MTHNDPGHSSNSKIDIFVGRPEKKKPFRAARQKSKNIKIAGSWPDVSNGPEFGEHRLEVVVLQRVREVAHVELAPGLVGRVARPIYRA